MDSEEFRKWGKEMVDFVADYWSTIRRRKPLPNVKPGYMRTLLPEEAPENPEDWKDIFADLEPIVLDGLTHWHHPHFFAYYPTAQSYPSILGDILSAGVACIGFTWNSSPSCTELEMVVMDWVAKMINLPACFLNSDTGPGAGMIQSTASDCTLVAFMASRFRTVEDKNINTKQLVAYCSDQAHSSVERAALLEAVTIRKLDTDQNYSLRGVTLVEAIMRDQKSGLHPFLVCVTLGTTPSCAFDNLEEIGPICQKFGLYLHIDAAYAGSAFVCPEYRHYLKGIEYADSFNFNAHKFFLTNFDCSLLWFKDARKVEKTFLVDPLYLKHQYQGQVTDYRNLQIPLGRRFRSLKLWFVLRHYGVSGLREHIRNQCCLAREFGKLVEEDDRFEIVAPIVLGLVCFRLKDTDEANERLLNQINEDRSIHLVPTRLKGRFVLRLAICSSLTNSKDLLFAWQVIQQAITKIH